MESDTKATPSLVDDFLKDKRITLSQLEKLCGDLDMFKHCIDNKLYDYIDDWKLFTSGFSILKKNPYKKVFLGEQLNKILQIRKQIQKFLGSFSKDYISFFNNFAVWVMFEQKKNNIYIPIHIIKRWCDLNNVDVSDLFEFMVRHPSYKHLYTSKDLWSKEVTIGKWLSNAKCVGIEAEESECLDSHQNKTIRFIINSPYSVLQGNAGCGKTTTICELTKQLTCANVQVIVAAFTHKAKSCVEKRITDEQIIIGTVHNIINLIKHGSMTRLFLILDESSMLDMELLADLGQSLLSKQCEYQVCFVGDYFQIQPVGRGEVFRSLVEGNINVETLTKCYRTDIADLFNAYNMVRAGKLPNSSEHFVVELLKTDNEISSFVGKFINKHLNQAQIICWQNKHIWMLNKWVQSALLKRKLIGPCGYKGLYLHDCVVYTGDNSELVTNAMTGKVICVHPNGIEVEWNNTKKVTMFTNVDKLYLSYAISAHKSQGSEYPDVLVVCYEVDKMMTCLDKRWLYTCITRGQNRVTLVSTENIYKFVSKPLMSVPIHNIAFLKTFETSNRIS